MTSKRINIQKEIDDIIEKEFNLLIEENKKNPLFQLLQTGKLKGMSLEELRKEILGD